MMAVVVGGWKTCVCVFVRELNTGYPTNASDDGTKFNILSQFRPTAGLTSDDCNVYDASHNVQTHADAFS